MKHIAVSLVRGSERYAVIVSGETHYRAEKMAESIGARWADKRADVWRREGYVGADDFSHAVDIAGRMERGESEWLSRKEG